MSFSISTFYHLFRTGIADTQSIVTYTISMSISGDLDASLVVQSAQASNFSFSYLWHTWTLKARSCCSLWEFHISYHSPRSGSILTSFNAFTLPFYSYVSGTNNLQRIQTSSYLSWHVFTIFIYFVYFMVNYIPQRRGWYAVENFAGIK